MDGVDISLYEGEIYDLVGETSCGKSTLDRTLIYLTEPTGDLVEVPDQGTTVMKCYQLIEIRRRVQMVFQDPYTSLDPKQRVDSILTEALRIHNIGTRELRIDTAVEIMKKVGLRLEHFYHCPHEFSGDQRQRVGLTRALILNPKIIIYDEPVSALGVSIQTQIINLLQDLREKGQISFLLIAHDMSVVKCVPDRVGVMYLGHMTGEAGTEELFRSMLHPHAKALLSTVSNPSPHTKRERIVLKGGLPSPINLSSGYVSHTCYPYTTEQCSVRTPYLKGVVSGHRAAYLMHEKGWSGQT